MKSASSAYTLSMLDAYSHKAAGMALQPALFLRCMRTWHMFASFCLSLTLDNTHIDQETGEMDDWEMCMRLLMLLNEEGNYILLVNCNPLYVTKKHFEH